MGVYYKGVAMEDSETRLKRHISTTSTFFLTIADYDDLLKMLIVDAREFKSQFIGDEIKTCALE